MNTAHRRPAVLANAVSVRAARRATIRGSIRRTALLAAALILAIGAAEASAKVVVHGTAVTVGNTVIVECGAIGVGAYASVAVTSCYTTNGVSAPAMTLPGPVAETAFTGRATSLSGSLCVSAQGTDINGSTSGSGLRCAPLVFGAGVVAG